MAHGYSKQPHYLLPLESNQPAAANWYYSNSFCGLFTQGPWAVANHWRMTLALHEMQKALGL